MHALELLLELLELYNTESKMFGNEIKESTWNYTNVLHVHFLSILCNYEHLHFT